MFARNGVTILTFLLQRQSSAQVLVGSCPNESEHFSWWWWGTEQGKMVKWQVMIMEDIPVGCSVSHCMLILMFRQKVDEVSVGGRWDDTVPGNGRLLMRKVRHCLPGWRLLYLLDAEPGVYYISSVNLHYLIHNITTLYIIGVPYIVVYHLWWSSKYRCCMCKSTVWYPQG